MLHELHISSHSISTIYHPQISHTTSAIHDKWLPMGHIILRKRTMWEILLRDSSMSHGSIFVELSQCCCWGGERCTLHAELRVTSALPPNVELTPSLTPDLHNHPPSPHQINVIATAFNLIIFGPNSTSGGKVKNKRVETDC